MAENGNLKIGPGWAAIIIMILGAIISQMVISYTHFQHIDDRLDQIEQSLQHHWEQGL